MQPNLSQIVSIFTCFQKKYQKHMLSLQVVCYILVIMDKSQFLRAERVFFFVVRLNFQYCQHRHQISSVIQSPLLQELELLKENVQHLAHFTPAVQVGWDQLKPDQSSWGVRDVKGSLSMIAHIPEGYRLVYNVFCLNYMSGSVNS